MDLHGEATRIVGLAELAKEDKAIVVRIAEIMAPYLQKAGIKKLKESECDRRIAVYYLQHFARLQRSFDQFDDEYWKRLRMTSRRVYREDRAVRHLIIVGAREARHQLWPEVKQTKQENANASGDQETENQEMVDSEGDSQGFDGMAGQPE